LLGLVMGLIAGLPILLLDLAGYFMGHQMGLSLSRVFNPDSNSDTDTLGQVLMLLATAAFLSLGGLEITISTLIGTFGKVPVGGLTPGSLPLDLVIATLASGVDLAVRVASPVTGIIVLLMVALGLISKTLPQLNVMSIGFTIKIIAGLAALMLAVGSIHQVAGDRIGQTLRDMSQWASSLGSAAPSHR
jgi:flagellar biosynthetic protein FliR